MGVHAISVPSSVHTSSPCPSRTRTREEDPTQGGNMTGVPDEEGFVAPAGVERHAQRHRWTRGPWLLRACRIAPLALTVALTVIATSLEPAPPSQRPRVVLDESAIRLVSHNDPIPSGADPLYPLNHTVDGKTESLGAPPNSGFEQAGGPGPTMTCRRPRSTRSPSPTGTSRQARSPTGRSPARPRSHRTRPADRSSRRERAIWSTRKTKSLSVWTERRRG